MSVYVSIHEIYRTGLTIPRRTAFVHDEFKDLVDLQLLMLAAISQLVLDDPRYEARALTN